MTGSPLGVPVADLTESQLWAMDISFRDGAHIDEFTGREMNPGELVRVTIGPEPEEIEAGS
jgi:hypothetical protein